MTGFQHQAARARKLNSAARSISRHFPPGLPVLLSLTDPARTPDPLALARALPCGSGLIYRHFGAEDRLEVAAGLARISQDRGLALLIAADPELAKSVGAAGVHWPEARIGEARAWRGAFAIQTASAHSRRAIWRAERAGMDAALVSTVFPSNSPSAGRPMGPARLARLSLGTHLPLYGLGGINPDNIGRIAEFAGMAAVSAFN